MQCSNCGIELGEGATLCVVCGTAQSANNLHEPYPINPQPEVRIEDSLASDTWTATRILLTIAWSVFLASRRFSYSAESFGFALGTLILPFIIAYAITRKEQGWRRFSYWFLALGFFLALGSMPKGLGDLSTPDLAKELVGTKPLENGLSETDRETALVTRSIFADLRVWRKAHDDRVAAMTPEISRINSVQSFSSRGRIEHTVSIINQTLALDQENISMLNQVPALVKQHLAGTNLSEDQKQSYLKNFLESYNNTKIAEAQGQAFAAEQEWANATIDLYNYASQRISEIVIVGDQIQITNSRIREQFNDRLDRTAKLRRNYLAAQNNADAVKAEDLKKMGVTAADLGFD